MPSMLGAEFAVAGIGGIGAYYFVARRTAPKLLEKALQVEDLSLALPKGMKQEFSMSDKDRVLFKESMLESEEYKWLATQPGVEDRKHPNKKTLLEVVWYMAEWQLRLVEKYGYLLVQRDDQGNFQGAIGLMAPYQKWWRYHKHSQVAALSMGRKSMPEQLGCTKRFTAYNRELREKHVDFHEIAPEHWTISCLAVASNLQKKGLGRQLVETATKLCPRPIYLACPDHLKDFFHKVGFSLEKNFLVAAEGGNQDLERDCIYYNVMTCTK